MHRMNKPVILIATAICCLAGVQPTGATAARPSQQDTSPVTTLRTATRAVVLDIVVTDQNGRAVQNLQKGDFSLAEDGQEQGLASFEEVGIVSRRTVKFGKAPAEQILLIDEINAEFANLAYARYCIGKLLRKNGGRLDQPSSLMALTNEGLVLLHEATRDGNALFSALDSRGPNLPLLLGLGGRHNEMERISISLAAMHEIAAAGAGSNVRRNIIWISPGFPIISNSDIGAKSRSGLFESIRLLSAELLQARMIVYTVDPRGVPSNFGSIDVSS